MRPGSGDGVKGWVVGETEAGAKDGMDDWVRDHSRMRDNVASDS